MPKNQDVHRKPQVKLTPASLPQNRESPTEVPSSLLQAKMSPNTRRAYVADWTLFARWCHDMGLTALPATPETVANYFEFIGSTGELKLASIRRKKASISAAHRLEGHEPPPTNNREVRAVIKDISKELETPRRRARALLPKHVLEWLPKLPDNLLRVRDRAILTLGLSGGFRRKELAFIELRDLRFVDNGMVVLIRKPENDSERISRRVFVPTNPEPMLDPVDAVLEWLREAQLEAHIDNRGRLFRSLKGITIFYDLSIWGETVNRTVKRLVKAGGAVDPALFSGHSLRIGYIVSSISAGEDPQEVLQNTGISDLRTLTQYIPRKSVVIENNQICVGF